MCLDKAKHLIEKFFNGKFEVKKFLGEGSFAKVYLVNHNYLDTLMAIKIVKEPLNISTNKKEIFSEVTLASQLRHENIISIYDAAEITDFEDGKSHAYFVMEYVSGGDLEEFLNSFIQNDMFMPVGRSLDLIKQILMGLNTLHSANPPIVHRDLKPKNVLLSFNSSGDIVIKISDFGFAKAVTTGISDIDIAGTRPFMAPEIFNKSVSTGSDVYAVGVMFYQLLTNCYPYDVDKYTNEELIDLKPWQEELKPPSYYNNKVSQDLDRIVLKCLEVDSSLRYIDAGDLLNDVENAIDVYKSKQVVADDNHFDEYLDEYNDYVINDSVKKALDLAKCENGLGVAIEILEREILKDYDIRRYYSETLRMWKSEKPDLKLISKAFTVNLKAKNYNLACDLLKEAIAYNPSIKSRYNDYIDLWEIFIGLESHKSLFKSVSLLENLMDSSDEIRRIYENLIPALKTYSIEEIVVEAIRLINSNDLLSGANLMEFAVVCDRNVRRKYEYKLSLWKQNMKMHFRHSSEVKASTVDYAIDLGTTDSVLAYFNNGTPLIIKNHRTGEEFTPSAVLMDDEDNIEVGAGARDAILKNDDNAVSEFKYNMGFSVPFRFKKSSRVMFPEELSAIVLNDMRLSAYIDIGVIIEDAVICVPANSNPLKTRAVNEAADLAGLRSHPLILEPVAVSLAYGLDNRNGIWMIYDWGGATFNVSLIRSINGECELLATDGLESFGGNSLDWRIVNELFKPKIVQDLNLDDFRNDNPKYISSFVKLKNAAEAIKKDLTNDDVADISISNLFDGYDFKYTLEREELKQIIAPLVEHTFKMSRNLLDDNSFNDGDIEKIILVGGSSLSPIIQECIRDEFEIEIESTINPLTVVSQGAAIYAGSIEKHDVEIKREPLSVIFSRNNNHIIGKVFSKDLKSAFLGYSISFKNENGMIEVPLGIDGNFKVKIEDLKYDVMVHNKGKSVKMDERSPSVIHGNKIYIPYFNKEFDLKTTLNSHQIMEKYSRMIKEIEYINDYSTFDGREVQDYIEMLLEITRRDDIAIGQCEIYIDYLNVLVEDAKGNLEYSMLLENVKQKIEVIERNNLFEIGDIDEIIKNKDLDKLREVYNRLIGEYVALNRNDVIRQCYFSLKLDGIFINNEQLAESLFKNAQDALNENDYMRLFEIVELLWELDERSNVR